jgi:hypothetical protein
MNFPSEETSKRRIIRMKNTPTKNLSPPGEKKGEESSGDELYGEEFSGEDRSANQKI